jgi:hypothetical protein
MTRLRGFSSGFSPGFGSSKNQAYLQIITPAQLGSYEDGDIMSAVPWRRVRQERAEGLCFAKTIIDGKRRIARLNSNGNYDPGDILEDWFEATAEFKFEKISSTQGRITRLSDSNEIVFTNDEPFTQHNGKTVHLDIDRFINRRKKALAADGGAGRPIFGTPGSEYYYGGRTTASHDTLNSVWQAIETKTAYLESVECDRAHFSDHRKRLIIAVNDLTDEEAGLLTQPKIDVEAVTVDAVVADGNNWTATLSSTPPALASESGARLVYFEESEHIIVAVNGFDLTVDGSQPPTGSATIEAEVAKRGNRIEWRNLPDVVEADVVDRRTAVEIWGIRKHVRQSIVAAK